MISDEKMVPSFVIFLVYRAAVFAYDFSYNVFGDPVMSKYDSEVVTVVVDDGDSAAAVASKLKDAGIFAASGAGKEVLPLKKIAKIAETASSKVKLKKIRVAAYCRVSTDSDAQLESLEAQKTHYENYIP